MLKTGLPPTDTNSSIGLQDVKQFSAYEFSSIQMFSVEKKQFEFRALQTI